MLPGGGGCRDGKRHGKGKYTFQGGGFYDGEYSDDAKHGFGTMEYPDGSQYVGNFNANMKHGAGTYKLVDGAVYEGHFASGNMEGDGTYTWPSGVKYVGEWKVRESASLCSTARKGPGIVVGEGERGGGCARSNRSLAHAHVSPCLRLLARAGTRVVAVALPGRQAARGWDHVLQGWK